MRELQEKEIDQISGGFSPLTHAGIYADFSGLVTSFNPPQVVFVPGVGVPGLPGPGPSMPPGPGPQDRFGGS